MLVNFNHGNYKRHSVDSNIDISIRKLDNLCFIEEVVQSDEGCSTKRCMICIRPLL